MTITLTTPRIFGYRVYFETVRYPLEGRLLDCDKTECDTLLWIAGIIHIVISKEKR